MRSISEALSRCDYYSSPTVDAPPAAPRHPRLLALALIAALALALSGCATTKPEAFNHAGEHAAPTSLSAR